MLFLPHERLHEVILCRIWFTEQKQDEDTITYERSFNSKATVFSSGIWFWLRC